MKILDLEQLKDLPLMELAAIQDYMETVRDFLREEGRFYIYLQNTLLLKEAATHRIGIYHGDADKDKPFDFCKWLIDNKWHRAGENNLTRQVVLKKQCELGLLYIQINERTVSAWFYNDSETIFENPSIPTTKQEAETLFKLFRL
jgi:hypothetical protein